MVRILHDGTATADFCEIVVERHAAESMLLTTNREPIEWLGQLADPLLVQSALDRLQSFAYELVTEGGFYLPATAEPDHHHDHHEEEQLMLALLAFIIIALRPNTATTRSLGNRWTEF